MAKFYTHKTKALIAIVGGLVLLVSYQNFTSLKIPQVTGTPSLDVVRVPFTCDKATTYFEDGAQHYKRAVCEKYVQCPEGTRIAAAKYINHQESTDVSDKQIAALPYNTVKMLGKNFARTNSIDGSLLGRKTAFMQCIGYGRDVQCIVKGELLCVRDIEKDIKKIRFTEYTRKQWFTGGYWGVPKYCPKGSHVVSGKMASRLGNTWDQVKSLEKVNLDTYKVDQFQVLSNVGSNAPGVGFVPDYWSRSYGRENFYIKGGTYTLDLSARPSVGCAGGKTPYCGMVGELHCLPDGYQYKFKESSGSCVLNGKSIANGGKVIGYKTSSVAFGKKCESEIRICTNGALSGSYLYPSCSVTPGKSCTFGHEVKHGHEVNAYKSSSVAAGKKCESEVRTCNNGVLSGTFAYASCAPAKDKDKKSCTFNGKTIAHGAKVTASKTATVAAGKVCENQVRTCNNGVLSGAFTQSSCKVEAPKTCKLPSGKILQKGQKVTLFESEIGVWTCKGIVRTCNSPGLSGDQKFKYEKCKNFLDWLMKR